MSEPKQLLFKARVDEQAEPARFWLPGVHDPIIIIEGGTVILKVRDSLYTVERAPEGQADD